MFLRNIRSYKNHTTPHPRRRHSSQFFWLDLQMGSLRQTVRQSARRRNCPALRTPVRSNNHICYFSGNCNFIRAYNFPGYVPKLWPVRFTEYLTYRHFYSGKIVIDCFIGDIFPCQAFRRLLHTHHHSSSSSGSGKLCQLLATVKVGFVPVDTKKDRRYCSNFSLHCQPWNGSSMYLWKVDSMTKNKHCKNVIA
jgi:hypothetical protein